MNNKVFTNPCQPLPTFFVTKLKLLILFRLRFLGGLDCEPGFFPDIARQ